MASQEAKDFLRSHAGEVVAVAAILALIVGLLFAPRGEKPSVLGTKTRSPSPLATESPTPEPTFSFSPSPEPTLSPSPEPSPSPQATRSPAAPAALVCRNSTDPRCGSFRWDPRPDADRPLEIKVEWSPESPQAGETVTFTVTVTDPDAPIENLAAGYGDPSRARLSLCHQTRYGPWTPAAKKAGSLKRTYTHVYSKAGKYTANFVAVSGGCDSPYGGLLEQQVPITVTSPD